VNPALYLTGAIALIGALGWSLYAIAATVIPAVPKITAALQGRGGVE
jgi:hypothetical protein